VTESKVHFFGDVTQNLCEQGKHACLGKGETSPEGRCRVLRPLKIVGAALPGGKRGGNSGRPGGERKIAGGHTERES